MFNETQYIPILRHKKAELYALRNILESDCKNITPLVEVRPNILKLKQNPRFERNEDLFYEVMKRTAEAWGNRPYFADFYLDEHLDGFRRHPISYYFDELKNLDLCATPVTGMQRTTTYQDAVSAIVREQNTDLCIRVLKDDLAGGRLASDLTRLLNRAGRTPARTHLLLDLGITQKNHLDFLEICSRLPFLKDWLSFTIASGAFPKDLVGFKKNGEYLISRDDYEYWQRAVLLAMGRERIPSFADFTIQHAEYSEPPEDSNPSASIRYTYDKNWVVMRGEGLKNKNGRKNEQYWAQAVLLSQRAEYCGKKFSFGDDYIDQKSRRGSTFGNPETWLRAGINHHITFASRQIAGQFSLSQVALPSSQYGRISTFERGWNRPRLVLPKTRHQRPLFPRFSQN